MDPARELASVATLLGDPTRAKMLTDLMDGRAWTATEMAIAGGVSASTASSHLARLSKAGVLTVRRQGRYRYYSIASREVAAAIEGLTSLAAMTDRLPRPGPRDPALRRARVCYDHLAGEMGVRLYERLGETGVITGDDGALSLTARGESWCGAVGIALEELRAGRRPLCRACLDWSERRTHLAGALGAAILDRLFAWRIARRVRGSRAIILAPRGESFITRLEPVR